MKALQTTLFLSLLAASAEAQIELGGRNLFTLEGDVFLGRFGWDVAAGDVNGDGFDDLISGAPSESAPGTNQGRVWVFSGFDGTVLHEIESPTSSGDFGEAVAVLGDLNGDGAAEFAAGAPEGEVAGQFPGYVVIYDGATGVAGATLEGDVYFDAFGQSVASAGDVNADGTPDIVVGAPRPQTSGPFAPGEGLVRVFSGADLQPLATVGGANLYDNYGDAVGAAGDVNLDGFDDVIVGVPGFDSNGFSANGRVEILSGEWITSTSQGLAPTTPQVLGAVDGSFDIGSLGFSVAGVGDVNGDGFPDCLAGAPRSDLNGFYRGVAELISGEWIATTAAGGTPATPAVLDRFAGEGERDLFGHAVCALGDVDGDLVPDFVIGGPENFSPGPGPGYATIYSGATGDDIHTYRGSAGGDRVGWVLDGGSIDFDADGTPDVAMGSDLGSGEINGVGTAHMLSGRQLELSADEHLLSIAKGGTQQFLLDAGDENSGDLYLVLGTASGITPATPVPGTAFDLPLVADDYLLATLGLGVAFLVDPFGTLDPGGEAEPSFEVAAGILPPALAGLTLHHAYITLRVTTILEITSASRAVPLTLT